MNITQTFYNDLATQYDKLFLDWHSATKEQAEILDKLFRENGFDTSAKVLDCACGIGTQTLQWIMLCRICFPKKPWKLPSKA